MFCPHKNAYLQSRSQNLNPRVLNRVVEEARRVPVRDPHDALPPFHRLTSEQPCFPMDNLDVTKRPVAFGRWALPKLRRELHCDDRMKVYQAICSICEMVHDPEKGYEAIKLRIADRLADLLKHDCWAIRERVLMALTTMAGLLDGKMQIVHNPLIMHNMTDLVVEEPNEVQIKNAALLNMLSRNFIVADYLYCFGFIPVLLCNVVIADPDIAVIHLDTLTFLMYGEGKNKALELGAFNLFVQLLNRDHRGIKAKAAECLTILTSSTYGKEIALEQQTMKLLNKFIHYENPEIYTAALSALMFCTIKSRAKVKAKDIKNLPDRLMMFVKDWKHPAAQLYSIKTLTNICEYPMMRKQVLDKYIDEIKGTYTHGDETIKRHKEILINVVEWVPWSAT